MGRINLEFLVFSIPAILIAIIFHELSHGMVAYWLGDDTAKNQGRLTLNPIKHIDPLGFLSMLLFRFGWARPVPVNPNNFENRKIGMFLVSIAGPMSNFLLAVIISLFINLQITDNFYILQFFVTLLIYNIFLGLFNLLPFPPLDGSKILASILPEKVEYFMYKNERYFYIILIILIFTEQVSRILIPTANFLLNTVLGLWG